MSWYEYQPYVSVAERRAKAMKKLAQLRKKGLEIKPIEIEGRKIAKTFWGKGWCDHLESFSDYENRLPRGRSYVRNGAVCHLDIKTGAVEAMVSGTSLYTVKIAIKPLSKNKWTKVKSRSAGEIGSLLELLRGRLSANVMSVVTDRKEGLFPLPGEITLDCSCPDWAVMCKHVAAVLYGVGSRLDESPELLFILRGVDHEELISAPIDSATSEGTGGRRRIADDKLGDVFGIELAPPPAPGKTQSDARRKKSSTTASGRGITGKRVSNLRIKFGMSRADFAALLGVSVTTVANWEKNPGLLGLRLQSQEAFDAVKKLTKKEAIAKVKADRKKR